MRKTRSGAGGSRGRNGAESIAAVSEPPITMEVMVRIQAIALLESDGGYTVIIPSLGCATEGDTLEEAQTNAVEAAEGWLTAQHERMKEEAIRATQG